MENRDILLISLGEHVFNHAIDSIYAYVNSNCVKASILHCAPDTDWIENKNKFKKITGAVDFTKFSNESLDKIADFAKDFKIIGINLTTILQLDLARQITDVCKEKYGKIVVWGGTAVVCDPKLCLNYTDYVCSHDGEEFVVEFVKNINDIEKLRQIPGIGYVDNGNAILVPAKEVFDIKKNNDPKFVNDQRYVLSSEIRKISDEELLNQCNRAGYRIHSVRGCKFSCTYCCNSAFKKIYKTQKIRIQSASNIIKEICQVKDNLNGLRYVHFADDDFFIRSEDELRDFCSNYSKLINLPLSMNIALKSLNEEKLKIFDEYNVNVVLYKFGLQSGSERVNKQVYKRPFKADHYLEKFELLARRGERILMDIISANPYETINDKYEHAKFLLKLSMLINKHKNNYGNKKVHKEIEIWDHHLTFFPGTELHKKAVADGIIDLDENMKMLKERSEHRSLNKSEFDLDRIIITFFKSSLKNKFSLALFKATCNMKLLGIISASTRLIYWLYIIKIKLSLKKIDYSSPVR